MKPVVLITGAYGFIGRYTAKQYHENGYLVIGMGHGRWEQDEYLDWGIDVWYECGITMGNLRANAKNVDVIVHCAGSGSVGDSIQNPMIDFERTVLTTHFVLEYIRLYAPKAKLVYPSSAAVYGGQTHLPLKESDSLNPISPYGYHKKMVEELCHMYAKQYGTQVIVMRLFSVYGNTLRKQLLWDACEKIKKGNNLFWGTGEETRDWINVVDVARLLYMAKDKAGTDCKVVNVAGGINVRIDQVLNSLFSAYETDMVPAFGGEVNRGNPNHYLADVTQITNWGWKPSIALEKGIAEYVKWYKQS